jgi:outer membrane protein TolC
VKRQVLLVASMASVLLSGCMVGPKYVEPAAPAPPSFKETTEWKEGDGWKIAQPNDQSLRNKWWEAYGDPKLNELEDQVEPSNYSLKVAEANFRQARAAIRFNRAAEAPTIGTSPSISSVRDSANQPYFPSSLVNNGNGEFALPVDLSYEIDLWGRVRTGKRRRPCDSEAKSSRRIGDRLLRNPKCRRPGKAAYRYGKGI